MQIRSQKSIKVTPLLQFKANQAVAFVMSWSSALIKDISKPENLIISSEIAVVIADKFPKAQHHYLVLPLDDIPSIFHVRKDCASVSSVLLFQVTFFSLRLVEPEPSVAFGGAASAGQERCGSERSPVAGLQRGISRGAEHAKASPARHLQGLRIKKPEDQEALELIQHRAVCALHK